MMKKRCGATSASCTTPRAKGPAGVFLIPEVREFVRDRSAALMLDGVYFGSSFRDVVHGHAPRQDESIVLAARVSDPRPFGWINVDSHSGEVLNIVEKPTFPPEPSVNYFVQTHLYFYGPDVVRRVERIPPQQGEVGVSPLHTSYISGGKLTILELADKPEDPLIWDDAGTPEKPIALALCVQQRQAKSGRPIGAPHLTAMEAGWVSKDEVRTMAEENPKSPYWQAILSVLNDDLSPG